MRRMSVAKLIGVLACAIMFMATNEAHADLCQDPRIQDEIAASAEQLKPFTPECRVLTAPFEGFGARQNIEVAYVLREAKWSYDIVATRFDAFALLPTGQLLAQGSHYRVIPMPSEGALSFLFTSLKIGNGRCCMDQDLVIEDAHLERRGNTLCAVYRLKAPFTGGFQDCGYKQQSGSVGWVSGATTWQEAGEIGCQQLAMATGKACGGPYNSALEPKILADPDGSLYYHVTVRSLVRVMTERATKNSTPVLYEIHEYRVEMMGGNATLLDHHEWPSQ